MVTRASVFTIPLVFLLVASCGSDEPSMDQADLAQIQAEASCDTFAAVFIETVGGGSDMTREEGVTAISRAADGAEEAAALEEVYRGLASSMRGLANGMADRDNSVIMRNLEGTRTLCDAVFDVRDDRRGDRRDEG